MTPCIPVRPHLFPTGYSAYTVLVCFVFTCCLWIIGWMDLFWIDKSNINPHVWSKLLLFSVCTRRKPGKQLYTFVSISWWNISKSRHFYCRVAICEHNFELLYSVIIRINQFDTVNILKYYANQTEFVRSYLHKERYGVILHILLAWNIFTSALLTSRTYSFALRHPSMHCEVCSILLTKKKAWRETTTGWDQRHKPWR